MSRGKSFDHKRRGHPGNFPDHTFVEEKNSSRQFEEVEDIVTHEAFKNRIKTGENEE
ncbi:hypothetical protein JOC77_003108 [Peribacillus deserti]|uniref:Uncharacterized protein n=1 Tax=Peribacillus deserti TaxID=673318 RepID=A0ABS2QLS1_9BACI|nr:hypothetical protein [Peribacillus deserti]MBM7693664.1 hypothetical protein [Peribacillus deserti]